MAVAPLELACQSCGAKLVVQATQRTARCPYCDSPSVIDRPATPDRPDPVFAIGFVVDGNRARTLLRGFLGKHRWAPKALQLAAVERVEGIYLPVYLYSAVADTSYRASIGENYTEMEYDARRKRMRRVTKTEYRSLDGNHRCYVDDLVVTASDGLPNTELEAIEPFDLAGLRRFSPALVSGWISEEPSVARGASLELAREEAQNSVRGRLGGFMPGDSHRNLQAATKVVDEAMDLVLLPIWVCAVRWRADRPPIRLLVNGQTGKIAGKIPLSWARIGTVVAAVIGAGLGLIGLGLLLGALW